MGVKAGCPKGKHNSVETQIKPGERRSIVTEFQRGRIPHNKGAGSHKCKMCDKIVKSYRIYCSRECLYKDKEYTSRIGWKKGIKNPNISGDKNHFFGKIGEECTNWKGGVSKVDKLCRCMNEYKKWRSDVFVRDSWTCRTCGINGVYVTAHHIKSFSSIIKENGIKDINDARKCAFMWDISNGITLCETCHKLTDNYSGRGK